MPRVALSQLVVLALLLLSPRLAAAEPPAPLEAPAGQASQPGDPAPRSADANYCVLRPFLRLSAGAGADIYMVSRGSGRSAYFDPFAAEGFGRMDLVLGHDIAADPGLRIQLDYRAVGFANGDVLAHRHLLELGFAIGEVWHFSAGGGVTVRHFFDNGPADLSANMSIGTGFTAGAFTVELDVLSLDFMRAAGVGFVAWTPSVTLGFAIR